MRVVLVLLALTGALAPAAASACGASHACMDVVFVLVGSNPTGGRLVSFYAWGGAPGPGEVVAKALNAATLPVRCHYDTDLCQTPRATQTPIRPGECLDVAVALVVGQPAIVEIRADDSVFVGLQTSAARTASYCL